MARSVVWKTTAAGALLALLTWAGIAVTGGTQLTLIAGTVAVATLIALVLVSRPRGHRPAADGPHGDFSEDRAALSSRLRAIEQGRPPYS